MRLSIEISKEQHSQIKALAAMKQTSIKNLVLTEVLGNNASKEDGTEDLIAFLTERLEQSENSDSSPFTIDDIAADIIARKSKS